MKTNSGLAKFIQKKIWTEWKSIQNKKLKTNELILKIKIDHTGTGYTNNKANVIKMN